MSVVGAKSKKEKNRKLFATTKNSFSHYPMPVGGKRVIYPSSVFRVGEQKKLLNFYAIYDSGLFVWEFQNEYNIMKSVANVDKRKCVNGVFFSFFFFLYIITVDNRVLISSYAFFSFQITNAIRIITGRRIIIYSPFTKFNNNNNIVYE